MCCTVSIWNKLESQCEVHKYINWPQLTFCVFHLGDIEQQVCPVLIELCSIDSTDDFRTEAVTVSIALGKSLTSTIV